MTHKYINFLGLLTASAIFLPKTKCELKKEALKPYA